MQLHNFKNSNQTFSTVKFKSDPSIITVSWRSSQTLFLRVPLNHISVSLSLGFFGAPTVQFITKRNSGFCVFKCFDQIRKRSLFRPFKSLYISFFREHLDQKQNSFETTLCSIIDQYYEATSSHMVDFIIIRQCPSKSIWSVVSKNFLKTGSSGVNEQKKYQCLAKCNIINQAPISIHQSLLNTRKANFDVESIFLLKSVIQFWNFEV